MHRRMCHPHWAHHWHRAAHRHRRHTHCRLLVNTVEKSVHLVIDSLLLHALHAPDILISMHHYITDLLAYHTRARRHSWHHAGHHTRHHAWHHSWVHSICHHGVGLSRIRIHHAVRRPISCPNRVTTLSLSILRLRVFVIVLYLNPFSSSIVVGIYVL